jgi:hypothetical protein
LRQRAVYPRFTRDIEAKIVAWVQEHEFLYIMTHELYCNRYKKQAAWEELAAELKVDTKRLKTFWNGLRTRFGKLTNKKSGDPAPTFSERDQWILDNLGFVNTLLGSRVSPRRPSRGPSPKLPALQHSHSQIFVLHLSLQFLYQMSVSLASSSPPWTDVPVILLSS